MLNSREILELIKEEGLIKDYIDVSVQLQPSGFDLSLSEVHEYADTGRVDFTNRERHLASTIPIKEDEEGWYTLHKGCYLVVFNETVKIPLDTVAIARTRSTLLRSGASVETAVWDPGYHGRSSSLLVVHNPKGIKLKKNARIAQLLFFRIKEVEEGYRGIYQKERLK
ncbi:deoxyuridine 5'-triphosphate nucleotidohydrolase [Candidatus Bathyarchaeota archaeon]|nr:deoxyuridine 5'-triphosphate nucleotidohydrolase [Candidatus Bathyarchaeota archaeon]